MSPVSSFVISCLALVISLITIWLSYFRRGTVHMTKPAFIAFNYDLVGDKPKAKIFIRSLLYATGKRGQIIENMFIVVHCGKNRQIFNVWGHGDEKLSRGSGLFVGETGIATNHHFNPPSNVDFYPFQPGEYELCIYATLVGKKTQTKLSSINLTVPENARKDLHQAESAIWFDWAPDSGNYHAHIETRHVQHF
jgi:hypothetical protein